LCHYEQGRRLGAETLKNEDECASSESGRHPIGIGSINSFAFLGRSCCCDIGVDLYSRRNERNEWEKVCNY